MQQDDSYLEASVSEAPAVVVLVSAEQDVGQARLAHTRRPQDDDPRTVIPENERWTIYQFADHFV